MIRTVIQQRGEEFFAAIPEEDMERFSLQVGDAMVFVPQVECGEAGVLSVTLDTLVDEIFVEYEEAFRYLADR